MTTFINPISLFKKTIHERPNQIAMYSSKINISYCQIDELSDIFAGNLILLGVKKGDRVAIKIERSIVFFIVIIALWKIGAHFVTFDLFYSPTKTLEIFNESAAKLLIVDNNEDKYNGCAVSVQRLKQSNDVSVQFVNLVPDNVAYVIYTSGSTGKPKAIPITFANLHNHLEKQNPYIKSLKKLKVNNLASIASINFDAIVWEFLFFISGFKLYVFTNEQTSNIDNMAEIIRTYCLSIPVITPSRLSVYLKSKLFRDALKKTKYICMGGEKPIKNDVNTIHSISDALIVNAYGPAEATIVVCYKEIIDSKADFTIGKPFGDNKCYIVNKNHEIINEPNVDGELILIGSQITKGYLNNSQKNTQQFVQNCFGHGTAYKTGDIACWTKDREILIKGREDFQFKINGQRVESGAIEHEIAKYPLITNANVFQFVYNDKNILACIYTATKKIPQKDLQNFLIGRLSDYMIPHFFFRTDEIPLGGTEKFDLNLARTLAKVAYTVFENKVMVSRTATPRNNLDKILLQTLKDVSGVKNIDIQTNFKTCGMDSLSLVTLTYMLKDKNIEIKFEDIFATNTMKELSDLISSRRPNTSLIGNIKNKLLLNKYVRLNSFNNREECRTNKNQNILVTGGNGFLGVNLIRKLIRLNKTIYCPIRAQNLFFAVQKFKSSLTQFSENISAEIFRRLNNSLFLIPIKGYSQKFWGLPEKKYKFLQNTVTVVVHCAANVSHFADINESVKNNVDIATEMANFVQKRHIKFFHISTMSVSSTDFPNLNGHDCSPNKIFNEKSLWVKQPVSNTYVQSKLLAEMKLIDLSMRKEINLSIIRLGNLANNSDDGSFQNNYNKNAFALMIRSWLLLKKIPSYLKNELLDVSPINETIDAIVEILKHDNWKFNIYHAYTSKLINFNNLISYFKRSGYNISFVSTSEFKATLQKKRKTKQWENIIAGLFPYLAKNDIVRLHNNIEITNKITTAFLGKYEYQWRDIDLDYVKRYIDFFKKHYFFN